MAREQPPVLSMKRLRKVGTLIRIIYRHQQMAVSGQEMAYTSSFNARTDEMPASRLILSVSRRNLVLDGFPNAFWYSAA